ncbi:MAG: hypothetical protein CL833_07785, partial [Crocinitomicaceae bacterium]|nr:hypothetical protein [Crocinitomicaceae bacterium]
NAIYRHGGGGGGATGNGSDAQNDSTNPNADGGAGVSSRYLDGNLRFYGGGGGGGTRSGANPSTGDDGGGDGAYDNGLISSQAEAGTDGTGGGGGGGGAFSGFQSGADGGDGVLIIRVPQEEPVATTTGSPTIRTYTYLSVAYRSYEFRNSGTIVW